jgi:YHS domain-containing protein
MGTVTAQDRKQQFNVSKAGLAIDGYDPVAYFTKGQAIEGRKEIATVYGGITYRFASVENRNIFNNTLKSWNKDEANLKAKADKNWSKFY